MSHTVSFSFYLNLTEGHHGADDANNDLSLGFHILQMSDDDLEEQCDLQTYEELLADFMESNTKPIRFSPRALRK